MTKRIVVYCQFIIQSASSDINESVIKYRKRNNYQETIAALLRYGLNLISLNFHVYPFESTTIYD